MPQSPIQNAGGAGTAVEPRPYQARIAFQVLDLFLVKHAMMIDE